MSLYYSSDTTLLTAYNKLKTCFQIMTIKCQICIMENQELYLTPPSLAVADILIF